MLIRILKEEISNLKALNVPTVHTKLQSDCSRFWGGCLCTNLGHIYYGILFKLITNTANTVESGYQAHIRYLVHTAY